MAGEAVGRGSERGVARRLPVERAVDVCLQVLDAHAHREGLALHGHAALAQQLEDVARGVAAAQHHAPRGHALLADAPVVTRGRKRHAAHRAAGDVEVGHAASAAHLAARLLDLAHDVGHHVRQHVAAHMGLGVPEDLSLRPRGDEGLEDEAVRRALGARLKLAVREGTCAADAKLDVALGVERARLVVDAHDLATTGRVVSALDEQGLEAGARKRERAEQARAPGADDDRARCVATLDALREAEGALVHDAHVLVGPLLGKAGEKRPLLRRPARELDAQREREMHVPALAGVDRAAPALDGREVLLAHAQLARDGAAARGELARVGAVKCGEGDANPGDLEHGSPFRRGGRAYCHTTGCRCGALKNVVSSGESAPTCLRKPSHPGMRFDRA